MTDPEQDDVFEAYLKRRAVLPALDHELEPPAALDEAVLAKAREAIQPGDGSPIPAVAKADADRAAVASADVDSAATPPRAEPGANTDTSRAAAGSSSWGPCPIVDGPAGALGCAGGVGGNHIVVFVGGD